MGIYHPRRLLKDLIPAKQKSGTMFSLLLLLPGLLTAATLTKHLKAPSPIYTPPVYSEYNGHGHGLAYGHGHNNVAYNQGFANGGYVTPVKPGHVFTGYPSYSQGNHAVHHPVHAVHHPVHQVSHPVGQYTGSHQNHQHYPSVAQQLPYHPTQYLDSRFPGLGLKTANKPE